MNSELQDKGFCPFWNEHCILSFPRAYKFHSSFFEEPLEPFSSVIMLTDKTFILSLAPWRNRTCRSSPPLNRNLARRILVQSQFQLSNGEWWSRTYKTNRRTPSQDMDFSKPSYCDYERLWDLPTWCCGKGRRQSKRMKHISIRDGDTQVENSGSWEVEAEKGLSFYERLRSWAFWTVEVGTARPSPCLFWHSTCKYLGSIARQRPVVDDLVKFKLNYIHGYV